MLFQLSEKEPIALVQTRKGNPPYEWPVSHTCGLSSGPAYTVAGGSEGLAGGNEHKVVQKAHMHESKAAPGTILRQSG